MCSVFGCYNLQGRPSLIKLNASNLSNRVIYELRYAIEYDMLIQHREFRITPNMSYIQKIITLMPGICDIPTSPLLDNAERSHRDRIYNDGHKIETSNTSPFSLHENIQPMILLYSVVYSS